MGKYYIYEADGGGWWIHTPFDADFVEELKDAIPHRQRHWAPERKEWWISNRYIGTAQRVADGYFELSESSHQAQSNVPQLTKREASYLTLWVIPGAPPEVVKAAYRALAKLHHPDAGGDTATMQLINGAFEIVMAEVGR